MSLLENIEKDFKEAYKAKKEIELNTLRMLKSALKNLAIEKRNNNLEDQDVVSVIRKEIKKRQDSIESFAKAGRNDLLEKEEAELKVLENYVPAMLSEEDIVKIVDKIVAAGQDNFGLVMKEVMAQTKGQADGKVVQDIVKQKLNL